MTNRTAITAAIILSLAAASAPAASAMPGAPGGFLPTAKAASAAVYSRPEAAVRVDATQSGFDWGDAGLGAAGGLTLSVMAAGGAFAVSGRRSRRRTALPS